MAESYSHKFGQCLGDLLEEAMYPLLLSVAKDYNLFLDVKGERPTRSGVHLKWKDASGNNHLLDFVLEKGGTREVIGYPVAFIETAWRRYTKHSKNKAQEIQGALLPLYSTYSNYAPFLGAILAGEFTDPALKQLRSENFKVLYFPFALMIKCFKVGGFDLSFYEEKTEEETFRKKLLEWQNLSTAKKEKIKQCLIDLNKDEVDNFLKALTDSLRRKITRILIISLHGNQNEFTTAKEALKFVTEYDVSVNASLPFYQYEIQITYNDGSEVRSNFFNKPSALEFLELFAKG